MNESRYANRTATPAFTFLSIADQASCLYLNILLATTFPPILGLYAASYEYAWHWETSLPITFKLTFPARSHYYKLNPLIPETALK